MILPQSMCGAYHRLPNCLQESQHQVTPNHRTQERVHMLNVFELPLHSPLDTLICVLPPFGAKYFVKMILGSSWSPDVCKDNTCICLLLEPKCLQKSNINSYWSPDVYEKIRKIQCIEVHTCICIHTYIHTYYKISCNNIGKGWARFVWDRQYRKHRCCL